MISKYLDPKNEIAFKKIFGNEKNKDILITLLNEVLKNQLEVPIKGIQFINPSQEPEIVAKKQSIIDVLCCDQNKNYYIIEMQVADTGGFEERAQYYAYKAFVSQMGKGGMYEGLKEVIFLAFTNFLIFPEKEDYKSEQVKLDKKTLKKNMDKISFTFVDLVKFEQTCNKPLEELSIEEKFYYLLRRADETKPAELSALIKESPIIARTYDELERYNWTEGELLMYDGEEKRVRDNQAVLNQAIKLGEKKGIEKGKKAGMEARNIEIAKSMLKKRFSIDLIHEVTTLSKQTIEQLSIESGPVIGKN